MAWPTRKRNSKWYSPRINININVWLFLPTNRRNTRTHPHASKRKNDSWDLSTSFYSTAAWAKFGFQVCGADAKHYIHQLKIERTSMISGRLLTSVSPNFDVLSTFSDVKWAAQIHQNGPETAHIIWDAKLCRNKLSLYDILSFSYVVFYFRQCTHARVLLTSTTFPGRSVQSAITSKRRCLFLANNIRPKPGRTSGTRLVSLPKPLASVECHNLTFGPSPMATVDVAVDQLIVGTKWFKMLHCLPWVCCFHFLWQPYVMGGTIFLPCSFFLSSSSSSSFFPRLISAAVDWMSAILLHMAWP